MTMYPKVHGWVFCNISQYHDYIYAKTLTYHTNYDFAKEIDLGS